MTFEHTLTVRFHEVDRAGIAFFGRVFEYCHAAFEEALMAVDDRLGHIFAQGIGMPLVHCEADYVRPMRMGERLTVVLALERVGRKSMTFAYRVQSPDGELRATARLVHAIVKLDGMQPVEVPEVILGPLRRLGLVDDG